MNPPKSPEWQASQEQETSLEERMAVLTSGSEVLHDHLASIIENLPTPAPPRQQFLKRRYDEVVAKRDSLRQLLTSSSEKMKQGQALTEQERADIALAAKQYNEVLTLYRFMGSDVRFQLQESDKSSLGSQRMRSHVFQARKKAVNLMLKMFKGDEAVTAQSVEPFMDLKNIALASDIIARKIPKLPADAPLPLRSAYQRLTYLRDTELVKVLDAVEEGNGVVTVTGLDALMSEYVSLREDYEKQTEAYVQDESEFEKNEQSAIRSFLDAAGMYGLSVSEFNKLRSALNQPLPELTDEERAKLDQPLEEELDELHAKIIKNTESFNGNFTYRLFHISNGQEWDKANAALFMENLGAIVSDRERFEYVRNPAGDRHIDLLTTLATITSMEIVEEVAESLYESSSQANYARLNGLFAKLPADTQVRLAQRLQQSAGKTTVLMGEGADALSETARKALLEKSGTGYAARFQNIDELGIFERGKILKGLEGAYEELVIGKGMPPDEFNRIIKQIKFEKSVTGKLMNHFANPATFVIYAVYINQSPHKLQAALNLASFYGISRLTSLGVGAAAPKLGVKGGYATAAEFAIALGICFGLHKQINGASQAVDEFIPDSATKDLVPNILGVATVDVAFDAMNWQEYSSGAKVVNPETDWYKILSMESREFDSPLTREYVRTVEDWNKLVDKAIEKRARGNPEKEAKFALEKIDDDWKARKASDIRLSVYVLSQVHQSKLESALDGLVDTGLVRPAIDEMLSVATADDGLRNDKRFERALDWNFEEGPKAMRALDQKISSLGETEKEKSAKDFWQNYKAAALDLCRQVSVLRHLKLKGRQMYSKSEWLGGQSDWYDDDFPVTPLAHEGMMQTILYLSHRSSAEQLANADIYTSEKGAIKAMESLGTFGSEATPPPLQSLPSLDGRSIQ